MEATTIDQLFPDVLEEIFSHLSASDLKNCALVCKDWNETIGTSAVAMKKLKIVFRLGSDDISYGLRANREKMIQSSDESCRKHQNMEISIPDGSLTQLPSLDRFNLSQVKSLSLVFGSSRNIELNKVMELLSRMPLLQVLTVDFRTKCIIDTSNALAAQTKLTKLKQLNVKTGNSNQPVIKMFEFVIVDDITELTYSANPHSDAEIDEVADFIKSKKSLKKFKVSAILQLLQRHDFSGMNLESLNVHFTDCLFVDELDAVSDNFKMSLISNTHSLTSLSIPSWLMSKEIRALIFNRSRKLTSLVVGNDYGSWMKNLSPNEISHDLLLKTLKVDPAGEINGLAAILQRAPQLRKLTLGGHVANDTMKEVAISAPRLPELKIYSLPEIRRNDQRFNELKSLTVDQIYNVDSLASVLEMCPRIEIFACGSLHYKVNLGRLIDILLQQKTLKRLRLEHYGNTADLTKIICNKLNTNYGSLRSLEINHRGKFIFFDFPENPAEWNVEEQAARFAALK